MLGPYELPSNRLSREMYDNLVMPWEVHPPVTAFPRSHHTRREWNRGGRLDDGETDFFDGSEGESLRGLGNSLGTASMVTQWRNANPGLVGTENDCVESTIRNIARAMDLKDDDMDKPTLRLGSATSLLLFRRA
jgi:hypothetical protein